MLERLDSAELERELVGVDGVEATVKESHLKLLYRIACEDPILHGILEALLNCGDILLGHITALNLVNKLEAALEALVDGLDADDDVGELTTATGLLLECLAKLDGLGDSLLVGNLRTALVALYLELTTQTVDDDVEVELTHTRDNGLAGLLVGLHTECGVLLGELLKTNAELIEILLSLGLNRDTDNGIRELHGLKYDRSILRAESVAGADILETYACADIAAADFL